VFKLNKLPLLVVKQKTIWLRSYNFQNQGNIFAGDCRGVSFLWCILSKKFYYYLSDFSLIFDIDN